MNYFTDSFHLIWLMMNKKMPVEMKGKDRYGLSNCHSLDKRWICRLTFHLSPLNSVGPPPRPLLIGNGRGNVGKRQGKLHAVMWEVVKRLPVINEVNKDSTGEEDNDERNQTDMKPQMTMRRPALEVVVSLCPPRTISRVALILQKRGGLLIDSQLSSDALNEDDHDNSTPCIYGLNKNNDKLLIEVEAENVCIWGLTC